MSQAAIRPSALVCLVIAPTLWGGNFVVGGMIANDIPGVWINFLRWVIALVVILPFCLNSIWEHRATLARHWRGLTLTAFLGVTLFNGILYVALQNATVSIAAVGFAVTPLITAGFEALVRKSRPSNFLILGAVIALVGVLFVQWGALRDGTPIAGILLVMLAAIVWSAYCVSLKHCAPPVPGPANFASQILIGVAFLIPLLLTSESLDAKLIGKRELLGLLYLGVFAAAIAFWIWQQAVADVGPSEASLFMNFVPISSILIGVVFLNSTIAPKEIIAFCLVLAGVFVASRLNPWAENRVLVVPQAPVQGIVLPALPQRDPRLTQS